MKNTNKIIYIIPIIIIIISFILINNITNKDNNNDLIELKYTQILEKMNNKESFVLVVSRTTCSHCIDYKPKLKEITNLYDIDIYYIDYDKESNKNQEKFFNDFDLDGSTPITIFIKKGKQTNLFDRIEGDVDKKRVIKKLKELKYIK